MTISFTDRPSSQEHHHHHQQQQQQQVQPQMQGQEQEEDDDRTTKHILSFFIQWKDRLQQCKVNYSNQKENLEENDTPYNENNSRWQQQYKVDTDYHLEIYQLEQQLHQLHQLLYYGNLHHHHHPNLNRSTGSEYQSIMEEIIVFPSNHKMTHIDWISLTSIPILQDEFMKCQDMLQKIHTSRMMNSSTTNTYQRYHSHSKDGTRNGPFLFYKYRLQQKQQSTKNRPLLESSSTQSPPNVTMPMNTDELLQNANKKSSRRSTTTIGMDPMSSSSSMIIENLTNMTIIVDKDGNIVRQQPQPREETDMIRQPQYHSNVIGSMKDDCNSSQSSCNNNITKPKIIYQSMMMRNLYNCSIQLLGNYKSIYFVNVEHTKIDVCNPIQGAVHVTDCRQVSFIYGLQAQQLRLHNSFHIHCYNAMISAGTILEDCKDLIFYVPSNTSLDNIRNSIKDFNWLRNGMASPNFSIQICDPTTTTMMTHNDNLIDPIVNSQSTPTDHQTVEVSDQLSSSLPNDDDDNSDDDEI